MNLNEFVAAKRRAILGALAAGHAPSEGAYCPEMLAEVRVKGAPRLGTVRYEPTRIILEFLFTEPGSMASIFAVTLDAPERIVFLPVPKWVVETIWQGEIDGSFHFESDARRHLEGFMAEVDPEANAHWFSEDRAAKIKG